jgi:hypothetical protein
MRTSLAYPAALLFGICLVSCLALRRVVVGRRLGGGGEAEVGGG